MIAALFAIVVGLLVVAMRASLGTWLVFYWAFFRRPRSAQRAIVKTTAIKSLSGTSKLGEFLQRRKQPEIHAMSLDDQLTAIRATLASNESTLASLRTRDTVLIWVTVINVAVTSAVFLALFV